jgi:hypothetical protein
MDGDEHFGFRGRTFSPAEEWRDGGEEFAKGKLAEVAKMLVELAREEEARPRRRWWCFWRSERALARRVDWQRVHDLIDAARTVNDARYKLATEIELLEEANRSLAKQRDAALEGRLGEAHPKP